jgi:hypothetical protein
MMAKVVIEMEFDCEEFEDCSEEEQFHAIENALESGAESTNSYIKVKSIEIKKS